MSDKLTRRGRTKVVKKLKAQAGDQHLLCLKETLNGQNLCHLDRKPSRTHALYLSWQYYRIHEHMTPEKLGADPQMVALDYITNILTNYSV